MALAAVCSSAVFSEDALAVAAPATLLPVGAGGGGAITGPGPRAWPPERPPLPVVPLTAVTVIRRVVVARGGKAMVVAVPSLSSAGRATVEPSENVSVAAVTWSPRFGRSKIETAFSCTGPGHVSCSQLPAPPPEVAHSAV